MDKCAIILDIVEIALSLGIIFYLVKMHKDRKEE